MTNSLFVATSLHSSGINQFYQWSDMAKYAIKTLKHNFIVMASMCPMQEIGVFISLESCLNINVAFEKAPSFCHMVFIG
jgi:hypothetical protein